MLGLRIHRSAVLFGLVLPLAFLSPWIVQDQLLLSTVTLARALPGAPAVEDDDPHAMLNDAVYQFLPWEAEVRRALRSGRLPLWSDRIDGGSSPWANPQACVLPPAAMLARLVPLQHHLLAALALKMLVALQGAWLLARYLGARRFPSLVAGCSFALGGGIVAWALFPHSSTAAWVPWVTVAAIRVVRRPQPQAIAAATLVVGALLVSGHPETALGGGLLAAMCGGSLWSRRTGLLKGLGAAALAAGLGFGLAAPHLVPFAKVLPESQRAARTLGHSRSPQASGARWTEPRSWFGGEGEALLLSPTGPRAFGHAYREPSPRGISWPAVGSLYSGILILAGTIIACFGVTRRMLPFLLFAALSVLLAAQFLPLVRLTDVVPAAQAVNFNRMLGVSSLAMCVCAASGLTSLLRGRRRVRVASGLIVAGGVSLAVAFSGSTMLLWILGLGAVVLAPRRRPLAIALLAVVGVVDLVPWARDMLPVGHPELFYPRTPDVARLSEEVARDGPWRVVGSSFNYYPCLLAMYELEDIRHHNPLASRAYSAVLAGAFGFHADGRSYFSSFEVRNSAVLDFLNVRAVVAGRGIEAPPGLKPLAASRGGRRLYRNPDALRRWFLPTAADVVPAVRTLETVLDLEDPRRVVLGAEEVGEWRPSSRPWKPRAVQSVSVEPGEVVLEVHGRGERLVATSLVGPEGWTAVGGGRSLTTLTVNHAFLGIRVPAGVQEMTLRYRPPGFATGVGVFGVCGVVVVGLVVAPATRRRRRLRPARAAWRGWWRRS